MITKKLLGASILAAFIFVGCGEIQPSLGDALKGSYKITNGMTMDQE